MYTIERKDYYKICIYFGIVNFIIAVSCLYVFITSVAHGFCLEGSFIYLLFSIILILYYLIKYFRKDLNFTVLRIDDNGIYLCPKKNEGVFIPWEKIRYVTFVEDYNYSKIAILQYNKESHYLELTPYFRYGICLKPKKAIKAAYKYADNEKKIKDIKAPWFFTYEDCLWKEYMKTGTKK